ncbi:hypothetical protein FB99_12060 [Pantoea agglomerans]|nr:hypothetical protein FB99_12060 [Pantoea agglomerans]
MISVKDRRNLKEGKVRPVQLAGNKPFPASQGQIIFCGKCKTG